MMDFHDQRQNARLEAIERRVTAILEHLGLADPVPAEPAGVSPRVAALARAGRTLEAIRTHVQETGADLATARNAVAAIAT
jgi:hypothetical protein